MMKKPLKEVISTERGHFGRKRPYGELPLGWWCCGRNRKTLTAVKCGRKTDRNSYDRTLPWSLDAITQFAITGYLAARSGLHCTLLQWYVMLVSLCFDTKTSTLWPVDEYCISLPLHHSFFSSVHMVHLMPMRCSTIYQVRVYLHLSPVLPRGWDARAFTRLAKENWGEVERNDVCARMFLVSWVMLMNYINIHSSAFYIIIGWSNWILYQKSK